MTGLYPNISIVWQLAIFLFSIFILSQFIFKPLRNLFEKRFTEIDEKLQKSEKLKHQANQYMREREEIFNNARTRADDFRDNLLIEARYKSRKTIVAAHEASGELLISAGNEANGLAGEVREKNAIHNNEISKYLLAKIFEDADY